jgi:putative FmdB family regulatory protein
MPTYEYVCPDGHHFELVQRITEKPRAKCPTCGKPAERRISGGAGLIFKGSGFYITDYGKDGKGPRKEVPADSGGESAAAKKDAPADPTKKDPAPTPEAPSKKKKPPA